MKICGLSLFTLLGATALPASAAEPPSSNPATVAWTSCRPDTAGVVELQGTSPAGAGREMNAARGRGRPAGSVAIVKAADAHHGGAWGGTVIVGFTLRPGSTTFLGP